MIHPQPIKNLAILIVDDAKPPRKMLRRLLNTFGEYSFVEEESIENAKLKIILNKKINLILCDVKFPKQTGIDLLKWVRSGEAGAEMRNVPFVCCSSDFDKKIFEEARALGVSGFLEKPYNFVDLYRSLSAIFNWGEEVRKYFDR